MAIRAGQDQALFRPLDQQGNYTTGAVGCHRGHMEVLNVRNPKPGFRYYYHRTDESSRRRATMRGWDPVKITDPERMGEEKAADWKAAGIDSNVQRNDIVLCRMPEARYRELIERQDKLSASKQGDSAAEYLEEGRPLQELYGQGIYFKAPGHGFRHSEH